MNNNHRESYVKQMQTHIVQVSIFGTLSKISVILKKIDPIIRMKSVET